MSVFNYQKFEKNISNYITSPSFDLIKNKIDEFNINYLQNIEVLPEHIIYCIYKHNIDTLRYLYPIYINYEYTKTDKYNRYKTELYVLKCIDYDFFNGFQYLSSLNFKINDKCLEKCFNLYRDDFITYILDNLDLTKRFSYFSSLHGNIIDCNDFCFIENNKFKSSNRDEPFDCRDRCLENSKINLFALAYYTDKKFNTNNCCNQAFKYLDLVYNYGAIPNHYTLIYDQDISAINYCREKYNFDYVGDRTINDTMSILLDSYRREKWNINDESLDSFIEYLYKTDINKKINWDSELLRRAILCNCMPLVRFLIDTIKLREYNIYNFDFKYAHIDIILLVLSYVKPSELPLLNSAKYKRNVLNYNIGYVMRHIKLVDPCFRGLIYEDYTNMHPKLKKMCIRQLKKIKIRDNQIVEELKNEIPIEDDVIRYVICRYL